ncbi:MAG: DoxX family protein [Phycisphaerales bacterium JB037]
MTFRQSLACNMTPLLLRVVLAVTFLWAGLGKLVEHDVTVTQDNAQVLVNLGSITAAEAREKGFTVTDSPAESPNTDEPAADNPDQPEAPAEGEDDFFRPSGMAPDATNDYAGAASITLVAQDDADAGPWKLRRVEGLAMFIYAATMPVEEWNGKRLLPAELGKKGLPRYMAWAVMLTELAAGGFILIGFLTRIWGLALAVVMGTALYMTAIGPAILSGNNHLGFLPDYEVFDSNAWSKPLWQFALMMIGFAIMFAGAGAASIDRMLFGSIAGGDGDGDDDD